MPEANSGASDADASDVSESLSVLISVIEQQELVLQTKNKNMYTMSNINKQI